jgi:hypothetical protein
MTVRTPALSPLQVAIATRLEGDAPLAAELATIVGSAPPIPAVFSLGTAPKDHPTPLIELGDVAEGAWLTFSKGGNVDRQTLVIVTPRSEGIPKVASIYGHLVRLLESTPLVVAGHVVALARLELVTVYNDPNGTDTRGIVRFTVQSLNA